VAAGGQQRQRHDRQVFAEMGVDHVGVSREPGQ
jgi:hypothetical protein